MSGEEEEHAEDTSCEAVKDVVKKISSTTVECLRPKINIPEHIILVVDVSHEEGNTPFRLADGSKYCALYMVKRALTLFLQNKHTIDQRHKFALVAMHDIPVWIHDFTNDPQQIISDLEMVDEGPPISHCDLSLMFELIAHQISLPKSSNPAIIPPYIYRTILIYGRSHCLPQFLQGKELFSHLTQSPHFVLDVLYTHEQPSDDNKCEGIFDLLCGLDESGWSYVLEVSRNATKLHNYFGTLLAHPFQRPIQKDVHYALLPKQ
ncbi:BRISC and BRCA1-A complex member 1 [Chionoecetes opilio]|uniref:BRISC and BRCA1-A complex member 1 n=1 Tax=Chionoecetes opilio TaxID=41210 RepID=A0A8J5CFU6_CHIOP|nr:BRISC and BRCA1-A complex member 1 [Chionoecetes opilio]KAG0711976.1 BRISC and BRCA1-A complex member 1 [Chionoecetes opilio]KAG0711977.1 BRISC and BRCA1-A complex member 1 [Chionoecetes opilio]